MILSQVWYSVSIDTSRTEQYQWRADSIQIEFSKNGPNRSVWFSSGLNCLKLAVCFG